MLSTCERHEQERYWRDLQETVIHDRFVALLELISSAHTLSDIERAFQSIREVYGLANVIYHAVRIPGMEIEKPDPAADL